MTFDLQPETPDLVDDNGTSMTIEAIATACGVARFDASGGAMWWQEIESGMSGCSALSLGRDATAIVSAQPPPISPIRDCLGMDADSPSAVSAFLDVEDGHIIGLRRMFPPTTVTLDSGTVVESTPGSVQWHDPDGGVSDEIEMSFALQMLSRQDDVLVRTGPGTPSRLRFDDGSLFSTVFNDGTFTAFAAQLSRAGARWAWGVTATNAGLFSFVGGIAPYAGGVAVCIVVEENASIMDLRSGEVVALPEGLARPAIVVLMLDNDGALLDVAAHDRPSRSNGACVGVGEDVWVPLGEDDGLKLARVIGDRLVVETTLGTGAASVHIPAVALDGAPIFSVQLSSPVDVGALDPRREGTVVDGGITTSLTFKPTPTWLSPGAIAP